MVTSNSKSFCFWDYRHGHSAQLFQTLSSVPSLPFFHCCSIALSSYDYHRSTSSFHAYPLPVSDSACASQYMCAITCGQSLPATRSRSPLLSLPCPGTPGFSSLQLPLTLCCLYTFCPFSRRLPCSPHVYPDTSNPCIPLLPCGGPAPPRALKLLPSSVFLRGCTLTSIV